MKKNAAVLLVLLVGAGSVLLPTLWNPLKEPASRKDSPSQALQTIETSRIQPEQRRSPRSHLYQRRMPLDTCGATAAYGRLMPWKDPTSFDEIQQARTHIGHRLVAQTEATLPRLSALDKCQALIFKATMRMFEGEPKLNHRARFG